MLSLATAAFDGPVASGEVVTNFATSTATVIVCTGVFGVVESVALQAQINLNKTLQFYYITRWDRRVEHHDTTR